MRRRSLFHSIQKDVLCVAIDLVHDFERGKCGWEILISSLSLSRTLQFRYYTLYAIHVYVCDGSDFVDAISN